MLFLGRQGSAKIRKPKARDKRRIAPSMLEEPPSLIRFLSLSLSWSLRGLSSAASALFAIPLDAPILPYRILSSEYRELS